MPNGKKRLPMFFANGLSRRERKLFNEYLITLYPGKNLSDFSNDELMALLRQMRNIISCGADPVDTARRTAARYERDIIPHDAAEPTEDTIIESGKRHH